LGYWECLVLVFGIIILDFLINEILKRVLKPPPTWIAILAFWIAYILTRPLGASIGDFLTADHYPTFDPTTCSPVNTTEADLGCLDPDLYCVTNSSDPDLACPEGPNTCSDQQPTCYTPLACDRCWGWEGIV
jgi:hypothetical protein